MIYSVLAEDIMAQRNGIVVVACVLPTVSSWTLQDLSGAVAAGQYSTDDNGSRVQLQSIEDVAMGLPVKVSAIHVCVTNEPKYKIGLAILLVAVGKEIRSKMRLHSESSIIEMMYLLRNYGILDFPLTHTGAIKTKNVYDFIKARTSIDEFRKKQCKQKGLKTGRRIAFITDYPPGTECPELNCVICGNTKKCKHHKGNLDFRDMLRRMILLEENKRVRKASADTTTTSFDLLDNNSGMIPLRTQNLIFTNKVIEEASKKFTFRIYNMNNCLYEQIVDPTILRSKISKAIRDARKRIEKQERQQAAASAANNTKKQRTNSIGLNDDFSNMGIDPRRMKRFKLDDASYNCFLFGGG